MFSALIAVCGRFAIDLRFDRQAVRDAVVAELPPSGSLPSTNLPTYKIDFCIANPLKQRLPSGARLAEYLSDSTFYLKDDCGTYCCISDSAEQQIVRAPWIICFAVSEIGRDFGLFTLHASAVDWEGSGILFVGPKGAGKSTLSHYLADACKLGFIGDEMIVLDCDRLTIHAMSSVVSIQRNRRFAEKLQVIMPPHRITRGSSLKACFFTHIAPLVTENRFQRLSSEQLTRALQKNAWSKYCDLTDTQKGAIGSNAVGYLALLGLDLKRNAEVLLSVFAGSVGRG